MFCRNCAAQVDPNAAICVKCGVLRSSGRGFCPNCGKRTILLATTAWVVVRV
jgi:RNA polymerase subunit RPABC4/transcription elongation factor Spt4